MNGEAPDPGKRWTVRDRYGNEVYLTHERWEHIIDPENHENMAGCEANLLTTIEHGRRRQDADEPAKYHYQMAFRGLPFPFTHIKAVVLSRPGHDEDMKTVPNNFIVTAFLAEWGA